MGLAGLTLTVMFDNAVTVQPLAVVAVTQYVVDDEGVSVTDEDEAPVLHDYVTPPVAVNVMFCPEQIVELAGLIATWQSPVFARKASSKPPKEF